MQHTTTYLLKAFLSMMIKYQLKPYVIIAKLSDGSLKFCSTHGRSFILPAEYATIFDKYSDHIFLEMRESQKNLSKALSKKLKLIKQDLLTAGIIEKPRPSLRTIPERYKSQMTFFSIFDGKRAARSTYHQKLSNSRIAILGMGGVGCYVALSLLSSGVSFLTIIDYDKVEESNLNRQVLYSESDIGTYKIVAARRRLTEFNSSAKIDAVDRQIKSKIDLIDLVRNIDFLVCAADFPFHYIYSWVNEVCVKRNIPWIQANSAEATGFVGPLVIPGKTSCYGCIETAWKSKNPDYLYEIDMLNKHPQLYRDKSSTLGAAMGILGNFTALEIIKFITGFAKPATLNYQFSLDFGDLTFQKRYFRRDRNCPVCGH